MNKITVAEMLEDVKNLETWSLSENIDKKAIAAKYGIQSRKTAEIIQGILTKAAEDRWGRKKFDENDIAAFKQFCKMPELYNKIEPFFENEPEEFIKYLRDFYKKDLEDNNLMQYSTWKPSELKYRRIPYGKIYTIKFYQFILKYLEEHGSDNKATRDAYQEAVDLILNKLSEQLADFKERLLDNAEEQGRNYYKNIQTNLNEWEKNANDCERQRQEFIDNWRKEKRQGWYWRDSEYTRLEKKENTWRSMVATGKYILKKWNIDGYAKYCREEADKEYEMKKRTMAEKIVERDFDYSKLEFTNVKQDPKWIEMMITDGTKKVYARSIIAAEFSEKVKVHFRFILTDRK